MSTIGARDNVSFLQQSREIAACLLWVESGREIGIQPVGQYINLLGDIYTSVSEKLGTIFTLCYKYYSVLDRCFYMGIARFNKVAAAGLNSHL